jgi:hypothetical protein
MVENHPPNELADCERQLCPHRPENRERKGKEGKSEEHARVSEKLVDQRPKEENGNQDEENAWNHSREIRGCCDPPRSFGSRRRELPASALRANLGVTRVLVQPGTELYRITASTELTEEWLSVRDSVAVVAIAHSSSEK